MDQHRALGYLIAVAEYGSFTRAAERFRVPPSTVSRRISNLEARLGVTLLARTTRHVEPTELGRLYLQHVTPAMAALEHADMLVRDQSREPKGRLRISSIPDFGTRRVLPALDRLGELYPNILVDLELTDQMAELGPGGVDIAIRATATPPVGAVAHKLSENRYQLIAAADYLNMHGRPRNLADLTRHKGIFYRGPNHILEWKVQSADGRKDVDVSPAFISNSSDAILSALLAGQGVALLPEWGFPPELGASTLEVITLEDASLTVEGTAGSAVYLLYRRPEYELAKVRFAVELLLDEFGIERR